MPKRDSVAPPPFKTFGGKFYISDWIVSLLPPRDSYLTLIDTMTRSGAVMLAHDPRDKSEIVNDLDHRVTNFWKVLQDPTLFESLKRRLEATPFSEPEFNQSVRYLRSWRAAQGGQFAATKVEAAAHFYVLARLSRAGDCEAFTTVSTKRLRRQQNEQVSAWLTSIEKLPLIHARVARWLVLDRDVFELVPKFNKPDVVLYHDPPYLKEGNRGRASEEAYGEFDWAAEKHEEFLQLLGRYKECRHLISGYETELYARLLLGTGWKIHRSKPQPLHTAGGKEKRVQIECVYTNF